MSDPKIPRWFIDAKILFEKGHQEIAIDLIFDNFYAMFINEMFEVADVVLQAIEPDLDNLDSCVILAVIRSTLLAKHELKKRPQFIEKAKEIFDKREELTEELFNNLE